MLHKLVPEKNVKDFYFFYCSTLYACCAIFNKGPLQGIRVVLLCNKGRYFHSIEYYLRTLHPRLTLSGTGKTAAVPFSPSLFDF
jgi:hypothetical protein